MEHIQLRRNPCTVDIENIRRIVESTGFFYPYEINVAVELVEDFLHRGSKSGYNFIFYDASAETSGEKSPVTAGYVCYGPIECTSGSFDLYWIAVEQKFQRRGIGAVLLREAEKDIAVLNGRKIIIETSSQEKYAGTRRFYENAGYFLEGAIRDFYTSGDDKLIYTRTLLK